jgi:hypothetical protein
MTRKVILSRSLDPTKITVRTGTHCFLAPETPKSSFLESRLQMGDVFSNRPGNFSWIAESLITTLPLNDVDPLNLNRVYGA